MGRRKRVRTDLDEIVLPTEYHGMLAISKRMGWSKSMIKSRCIKYHFPLVRLPCNAFRGWQYYTNENLILAWYSGLIQNTRRYLLQPKGKGTDTIRERASPEGFPWQVPNNTSLLCIEETTSVQAQPSLEAVTSDNASDINELASPGPEGEGCDPPAAPAPPR